MLTFDDVDEAISEDEFLALENRVGKKLPNKMKTLYLQYNGGKPNPAFVHDDRHMFSVNAFDSVADILDNLDWYDEDSYPKGFKLGDLLPFAYDDFGHQFVLDITDENYGKVYFYTLEEQAEIWASWHSFEEFISRFVEDSEAEADLNKKCGVLS